MTAVYVVSANAVSPIYFKDLDRVKSLTSNTSQAEFLCRIIYFFKTTNIVENGIKWFTRSSQDLAELCKVSTRTIRRYLNQFEQQGYIIKKRRMFSRQHLYLTVTDKLINLLRSYKSSKTQKTAPILQADKMATCSNIVYGINTTKNKANTTELENQKKEKKKNNNFSSNTNTPEPELNTEGNAKKNACLTSDKKTTLSDYAEYERFTWSEVPNKNKLIVKKPESKQSKEKNKKFFSSNTKNTAQKLRRDRVSNVIGKKLSEVQEKYITSTVRNLGLKTEITKPQQLIDEMKEAVLNPKRFSKAKNFKHKINTMEKVIMRGTWRNTVGATGPDEQQVTIDSETGTATIDLTPSDNLDEHFSAEDNAFFAEIMQDIYKENAEKKRL